MMLRFGFEAFELKRSLPFACAEPWFLAFALRGSHLARPRAADGRASAARAW
jgi:hypothetical protein